MDNAGRFLKEVITETPPFPILESSQAQSEIIIIDDDDDEPAEDRAANLTLDLSLGGIYQNDSMPVLQDINRPRFHAESSSHARRRGKEPITLDDDENVPPPVATAPHRSGKEPIMNDQPHELSDESDSDDYLLSSPTWIDVSSVTAPNTPEFRQAIAKLGEQNSRPDLEGFSFAIFSHDVGPEYMIPQGLAPILTPRRRNGISFRANPRETSSANNSDAIVISAADPYGTAIVAKLSDDDNSNNSKINDQSKHMYSLLLAANLIDTPMQAFDESNNPSEKPKLDPSFVDVVKKMPVASVMGPDGKKTQGFVANYCSFCNKVVIVCQCHREFFSSEGFVAHAGITDLANAKKYIRLRPSSSSR